jgi:hypothetical protein
MNLVKSLLTLGATLLLFGPGRAFALPTQLFYKALSADGPLLANAGDLGVLIFDFDDSSIEACRYYMEWDDYTGVHNLSTSCYVNEAKPHGAATCSVNSQLGIDTIVTNDTTQPCAGFNTSGNPSPVLLLVAGEENVSGKLSGLIQFSGATTYLYAFEGVPMVI